MWESKTDVEAVQQRSLNTHKYFFRNVRFLKKDAKATLEAFAQTVAYLLCKKGEFKISKFGKFEVDFGTPRNKVVHKRKCVEEGRISIKFTASGYLNKKVLEYYGNPEGLQEDYEKCEN